MLSDSLESIDSLGCTRNVDGEAFAREVGSVGVEWLVHTARKVTEEVTESARVPKLVCSSDGRRRLGHTCNQAGFRHRRKIWYCTLTGEEEEPPYPGGR